jgi:serine/threonine-protein kinase
VIVAALVVLALAFAAFAIAQASGRRVVAPNVSGRSEDQARAAADRAGLHVVVDTRRRSDEPAGIVLEQRPEPGTWARRGGRVHVVLSDGPPPVPVPAVLGQLADQAEQALRGADFDVVVNHAFDEQVAKGNVVAQDPPANGQAPRGSTITLVVSDGPKPVPVPSVVGQPVDAATKAIKDARLTANRVDDFSDTVPQNQVISQDPPAGQEVPPGTKVTIHVSKGQELIEVPDVRGMAVEDAATKLQDLGFTVDIVNFKRGRPVKDQDPPGGTKLKRGASVQIIVARG